MTSETFKRLLSPNEQGSYYKSITESNRVSNLPTDSIIKRVGATTWGTTIKSLRSPDLKTNPQSNVTLLNSVGFRALNVLSYPLVAISSIRHGLNQVIDGQQPNGAKSPWYKVAAKSFVAVVTAPIELAALALAKVSDAAIFVATSPFRFIANLVKGESTNRDDKEREVARGREVYRGSEFDEESSHEHDRLWSEVSRDSDALYNSEFRESDSTIRHNPLDLSFGESKQNLHGDALMEATRYSEDARNVNQAMRLRDETEMGELCDLRDSFSSTIG